MTLSFNVENQDTRGIEVHYGTIIPGSWFISEDEVFIKTTISVRERYGIAINANTGKAEVFGCSSRVEMVEDQNINVMKR